MTGTVTPIRPKAKSGAQANRAVKVATISRPPWRTWKCSDLARHIRFVERYLTAPVVRVPMVLHRYQRQLFESWLDPATRVEMDRIARGNAKTTTTGAFIAAHVFLTDDAQCPVVASTMTQTELTIFGAVRTLLQTSELAELCRFYEGMGTKRIAVPSTNAVVIPLADKPSSLQGLAPSVAVLDEASEASPETWSALTLASGKRSESLALGISTPSFLPANAMLAVETAYRSGKSMPGFRFQSWAAPDGCDHRDEAMWRLANPALSTKPPILHIDALRTSVAMEGEQSFRCYRLAQWPTASAGGWLGEGGTERWEALTDEYAFVRGAETWAAVDMSLHHDSSAVVAIQRRPDGRLHAKARIWWPEDGQLDPSVVMEYLRQLDRDYRLVDVAFDPRFFDLPARMLEDEGLMMREEPQSLERMTPAVGGTFEAISRGQLTHDNDVTFRAQVLNAQPRYNERGFTLSKPKSTSKIDAAVALCMAHRAATFTDVPQPIDLEQLAVH